MKAESGSTFAPDRFVVVYQKAMTGFLPYSFPFWPAWMILERVIWIFTSGVVSTPFSNVGPSLLGESAAPPPLLGVAAAPPASLGVAGSVSVSLARPRLSALVKFFSLLFAERS